MSARYIVVFFRSAKNIFQPLPQTKAIQEFFTLENNFFLVHQARTMIIKFWLYNARVKKTDINARKNESRRHWNNNKVNEAEHWRGKLIQIFARGIIINILSPFNLRYCNIFFILCCVFLHISKFVVMKNMEK